MKFKLLVFLLISIKSFAQFNVAEPLINTGAYKITDTVYMAVNGNDANSGTINSPVKTFNAAMQKLPYGVSGVNGGNAYGLIMLKEGFYETNDFQQYVNNWQKGNTYKNISIQGIGKVVIGGTKNAPAASHLLILSGNHIFIKNIKLQYSAGIGILLNRTNTPRQHNILVEDVETDSLGNFAMLLQNVDTILVRNCIAKNAGRFGNESLKTPCQWPSGIKFFNCKNSAIHHCEIAYTRGEGLNFHNCETAIAYNNILHDNPLNFYNDNSAKVIAHSNHIYNTPGKYFRTCPADTGKIMAGGGFLFANEGACDNGNGPVYESCRTKCSFPTEFFRNIDSVFVYNNILQNVGEAFGFWEGRTDIVGVNCTKNVFIFNNTVIGASGMAGAGAKNFIDVFFPAYNIVFNTGYGTLQNVRIQNNIFAFDTAAYPNLRAANMHFNAQHPGPKDITFNNNLWVKKHAYFGADDIVRSNLPGSTYLLTDSLNSILPCAGNQAFVYEIPQFFPFLATDYSGKPRMHNTNAGALEYAEKCNTASIYNASKKYLSLQVYPNPCLNCTRFNINNLPDGAQFTYALFTLDGREISNGKVFKNQVIVAENLHGVYLLKISNNENIFTNKVIISR